MEPDNKTKHKERGGKKKASRPQDNEKELAKTAHKLADHDMEDDAELNQSSPNVDLDEGESARLGENTDLI